MKATASSAPSPRRTRAPSPRYRARRCESLTRHPAPPPSGAGRGILPRLPRATRSDRCRKSSATQPLSSKHQVQARPSHGQGGLFLRSTVGLSPPFPYRPPPRSRRRTGAARCGGCRNRSARWLICRGWRWSRPAWPPASRARAPHLHQAGTTIIGCLVGERSNIQCVVLKPSLRCYCISQTSRCTRTPAGGTASLAGRSALATAPCAPSNYISPSWSRSQATPGGTRSALCSDFDPNHSVRSLHSDRVRYSCHHPPTT